MPQSFADNAGNEKYVYTQNRELSWLRFNKRVLEEATDACVPPLERLKFISIYSSNLDEFFMVRVGSLFDVAAMSPSEKDSKTGLTPSMQLDRIYKTIPEMTSLKSRIYSSVMAELSKSAVKDREIKSLNAAEQKYINSFFVKSIQPVISPIIIGSHHPVPHLISKRLYIASRLCDRKGKSAVGIVPVPDAVAPFVRLEKTDGFSFVRTENIILNWAPTLFGSYLAAESCIISVTRNADISFDDEKFDDSENDFRNHVSHLLKKRESLSVIRLEINGKISDEFKTKLSNLVNVEKRQIFESSCPLNMKYVFSIPDLLPEGLKGELLYRPYKPAFPSDIDPKRAIIEQINEKDRLLFYPFDSVDPFLNLLNEAAESKDVISIKITIYRLASSSKIARTLCRAAENGKEVIVLMELRARFDEANNILWSKELEEAGCQVVYGVEDFKCHSKICLITTKSKGKPHYITQIGTGNYNEKTNAMYTDLSLMTANREIGEDGAKFFRNMLVNNLNGDYSELLVAPRGIKSEVIHLIDNEIAKGRDGYICVKANSVTEREVIDKLCEASQAGVEVQLIIRGICCILPEVPNYTENIHVTSIVGRFLEHARIYCFGKGYNAVLYISSADFMTRNLRSRVEIACPISDPDLKKQLLHILSCQLCDNAKASFMRPDGTYRRKVPTEGLPFDSQNEFMCNSIHGGIVPASKSDGLIELFRTFCRRLSSPRQ